MHHLLDHHGAVTAKRYEDLLTKWICSIRCDIVPIVEGPRRPGDCTKLVSGSTRAKAELGWTPERSTMHQMISDAWRWHQTGHYSK